MTRGKKTKQSLKDDEILMSFGERVRKQREKLNLSVYDLTGEDMPIRSRQHWQLIEKGQKNINLTTVFKIARSLKINPAKLIENITDN